tara:strand:- start:337 stop:2259 length:1923 start_codon:yes stop_codon:yes gene_type:complete
VPIVKNHIFRIIQIFIILILLPGSGLAFQDESVRFTILHTNDEHSHLIPHPAIDDHPQLSNSAQGGYARLASAIKQIKREKEGIEEPVLVLSGGDILGGPAFGWLPLKDGVAAEMKLFQMIGYDAITIGNHEFDYGSYQYADYLRAAGYPDAHSRTVLLGANTKPPSDHPLAEMDIRSHFIKELPNGLKIGIFGLIGNDAINKTASSEPVEFDDPIESARIAVQELMDSGADIIIALTHSGVPEDRALASAVPEIDIIVGGHTHTSLFEPIKVGNTVIVQAGSYLSYLGVLELEWNREEGSLKVMNTESGRAFLKPLDSGVEPDEEVASEVLRYTSMLNEWVVDLSDGRITDIRQPIATSSFTISGGRVMSETPVGNYITDAMKWAAEKATGNRVDIAVQASGAIRAEIKPGVEEWSAGQISFYDLIMSTGLGSGEDGNPGYPLVSVYMTGADIRKSIEVSLLLSQLRDNAYFLQYSGLRAAYDPNRSILFTIPFIDKPIPTYRGVLTAELDVGSGVYRSIDNDSDELFHVVTDRYVAGFLPLVGEILPKLNIILRDQEGNPVDLDERVIHEGNNELKVWQAVLNYTLSHQVREADLPEIPLRYESTENRLRIVPTLPLWVWPVAIFSVIVAVIIFLFRR